MEGIRTYEAAIFLNPNMSEQEAHTEIDGIKGIISSNSGDVTKVNFLGKKELRYRVQAFKFGYFFTILFTSGNHLLVKELNRLISLDDKVIRYQTTLVSDRRRKVKVNPRAKKGGDMSSTGEMFLGEFQF